MLKDIYHHFRAAYGNDQAILGSGLKKLMNDMEILNFNKY